jgi:hypothetical protein
MLPFETCASVGSEETIILEHLCFNQMFAQCIPKMYAAVSAKKTALA